MSGSDFRPWTAALKMELLIEVRVYNHFECPEVDHRG